MKPARRRRRLPALLALLAVALGVAAIVYGESDDSPGLQGIGVLIVAGTVVRVVRLAQRGRS